MGSKREHLIGALDLGLEGTWMGLCILLVKIEGGSVYDWLGKADENRLRSGEHRSPELFQGRLRASIRTRMHKDQPRSNYQGQTKSSQQEWNSAASP